MKCRMITDEEEKEFYSLLEEFLKWKKRADDWESITGNCFFNAQTTGCLHIGDVRPIALKRGIPIQESIREGSLCCDRWTIEMATILPISHRRLISIHTEEEIGNEASEIQDN
jgi:hypothetical protein